MRIGGALCLGGALFSAVAVTASQANAQAYCTYPRAPYCVSGFGTFGTNAQYQSCRADVERYLADVRRYTDCLRNEIDDVTRDANRTVDDFNRMAR